MGELMFLLKNARRRRVIQKVVAYDDGSGVELGTLAVEIAAAEQEIDPDDVTCKQRKRVYIGLYQCHLPKLDANGIIEFDGDQSGKVYSTDTTWAFNRTLESMLKLAGGENQ